MNVSKVGEKYIGEKHEVVVEHSLIVISDLLLSSDLRL